MKDDFHIDKVIQSQYSASPHIVRLINDFWEAINPEADISLIYDRMVNLNSAVGFGLDVWGRIVAVGRSLVAVDENAQYFQFDISPLSDERSQNFDNAPFYEPVNGLYSLDDEGYRVYILVKAMINIFDGTMPSINSMLRRLFGGKDISVISTEAPMVIRLLIREKIPEVAKQALLNLPWLPSGVGLDIYEVITPTFGFNGSNLHPFGNGTFPTHQPQYLDS